MKITGAGVGAKEGAGAGAGAAGHLSTALVLPPELLGSDQVTVDRLEDDLHKGFYADI